MKVFISWSKDYSKEIAIEVKNWIRSVIQATNPFVSDSDIDLGTLPLNKIDEQLSDSELGIIVVTPENYKSPWINYEAGAISNVVPGETKVIPILFGINISDLGSDPLTKFQMAKEFEKKTMQRVVESINNELEGNKLDARILEDTFELWWPFLEKNVSSITSKYSEKIEKETNKSIIAKNEPNSNNGEANNDQIENLLLMTDRNSRMIQEMSTLMHSKTIETKQKEGNVEELLMTIHKLRMIERDNVSRVDKALNNLEYFLKNGDEEALEKTYMLLKELRASTIGNVKSIDVSISRMENSLRNQ